MTAIPIAAPLPPAMIVLATLPVILATILWQGPRAELRDHLYYKKTESAVSWRVFEPRKYHEEVDILEIYKQEGEADGALDCSRYTYQVWRRLAGNWLERNSICLERQRDRHRKNGNGLLVVRVRAPINVSRPDVVFHALKDFAVERGFRRVLVLGNMGCCLPVLYDSAYESQHEKPSGR